MRQVGYLQRLYQDARSTEHKTQTIWVWTSKFCGDNVSYLWVIHMNLSMDTSWFNGKKGNRWWSVTGALSMYVLKFGCHSVTTLYAVPHGAIFWVCTMLTKVSHSVFFSACVTHNQTSKISWNHEFINYDSASARHSMSPPAVHYAHYDLYKKPF